MLSFGACNEPKGYPWCPKTEEKHGHFWVEGRELPLRPFVRNKTMARQQLSVLKRVSSVNLTPNQIRMIEEQIEECHLPEE